MDGIEIFALMDKIDKHKAILKAQEFIGANPLAKPTLPTMTEEINYSEPFTKSQQCYIRNDKAQTYTIQKGKPHQNGYIERFNRTFRDEVPNVFVFESLNQARLYTQAWMWVYNNERPHSSFGYLTLTQFLLK
jgi:putative transposase